MNNYNPNIHSNSDDFNNSEVIEDTELHIPAQIYQAELTRIEAIKTFLMKGSTVCKAVRSLTHLKSASSSPDPDPYRAFDTCLACPPDTKDRCIRYRETAISFMQKLDRLKNEIEDQTTTIRRLSLMPRHHQQQQQRQQQQRQRQQR